MFCTKIFLTQNQILVGFFTIEINLVMCQSVPTY